MILKNSEKKENNYFEFTVESDAKEFNDAVLAAYKKNKNQISIPGFRKGKAPLTVIEGMYGKEVFYQDALDELAQPAFDAGLDETEVEFIGRPSIVAADVTDERTATLTFSVELYPEVELGEYKGLEVEAVSTEVTDADVDNEVASVRKRNARKVTVEDRPAQTGDTANIDYEGFLDAEKTQPFDGGKGENHELELGSGSFVPGFEEQVVGMSIGEEKDINITFPKEYAEELAGKDVVFHVKVNSIAYSELPELDDDFAQDVSEFDTLADYLADIRAKIAARKEENARAAVRSAAIEKACENMKADLPETMVKSHLDAMIRNFASNYGLRDPEMPTEKIAEMMGMNEESVNKFIRPNAERETRVELLIRAVIEKEKIEATEEEIEAYLNKVAEEVQSKAEDIKKYFGEDYIVGELKKEKAMDLIANSAVQVEKKVEEKAEETKTEE